MKNNGGYLSPHFYYSRLLPARRSNGHSQTEINHRSMNLIDNFFRSALYVLKNIAIAPQITHKRVRP